MTKKQDNKYSHRRNSVAKYAHKYNKSLRFDTKQAKVKRGYIKHKGKEFD